MCTASTADTVPPLPPRSSPISHAARCAMSAKRWASIRCRWIGWRTRCTGGMAARLPTSGCGAPASIRAIRCSPRLLERVHELIGFPRHLSQHVGGFVISRGPLEELVPIENATMPDRTVIQWDKDDLDALGLLKVDVLGLGMLSALRKSLELLRDFRGRELHARFDPGRGSCRLRDDPARRHGRRVSDRDRARRCRCCRASSQRISTTW